MNSSPIETLSAVAIRLQQQNGDISVAGFELRQVSFGYIGLRCQHLARHTATVSEGAHTPAKTRKKAFFSRNQANRLRSRGSDGIGWKFDAHLHALYYM